MERLCGCIISGGGCDPIRVGAVANNSKYRIARMEQGSSAVFVALTVPISWLTSGIGRRSRVWVSSRARGF